MAVGGKGPFFCLSIALFSFFVFQFLPLSQSLNGDWWRGLFSPSKPIAQMAVGGEEPFFFVAPVSQSPKAIGGEGHPNMAFAPSISAIL